MTGACAPSQFQKAFPDEASCVAFLLERRGRMAFVCPDSGKRRAALLKSRPRLRLRSVVGSLRRHQRPETLTRFHNTGGFMSLSKMSFGLIVALGLFLGLVSPALAIDKYGELAAGQETYLDADFAGGREVTAGVVGPYWEITVYDSTGFKVANGVSAPYGYGIYCTVRWTPSTPGKHRIVLRNNDGATRGYRLEVH